MGCGGSIEKFLDVASTERNFNLYHSGLVDGHCIPIDPHYLVFKGKEFGYHPQVILAGKSINDYIPMHVTEMMINALNETGEVNKGSKVLLAHGVDV